MGRYSKIYFQRVYPLIPILGRFKDIAIELWLDELEPIFGNVKGKRILDIGTGCGHKAFLLSFLGAEVEAFDINPAFISECEEAKRKIKERITINFSIGDATLMKGYPDESFDYILCSEVIEHLTPSEGKGLITDMARKLKRGGITYITTPNGTVRVSDMEREKEKHQHEKLWSMKELEEELVMQGLKPIKKTYDCHRLSLLRGKLFYPINELDIKLTLTKKILHLIQKLYVSITMPFIRAFNMVIYPLLLFLYRRYERNRQNDPSGLTLIIAATRFNFNR